MNKDEIGVGWLFHQKKKLYIYNVMCFQCQLNIFNLMYKIKKN